MLYFGEQRSENVNTATKVFVNACLMVSPGLAGFGQVRHLVVHKSLFSSP